MNFKTLKSAIYQEYGGHGSIRRYAESVGRSLQSVSRTCARGAVVDVDTGIIYMPIKGEKFRSFTPVEIGVGEGFDV